MTGKKYHILFIVVCCWFLAVPGVLWSPADAGTTATVAINGKILPHAETDFNGVTIATVNGKQQVNLNQAETQGSFQFSGNTVTVQNPGKGWSQVQYVGSSVTTENDNVVVEQIQKVNLQSEPVTELLGGTIGTASAQINVGLSEFVSDIAISQEIVEGATATVTNSFQLAATDSNLVVEAVAYTVQFYNTDEVNSCLSAEAVKLTLGIDHAWVIANAPNGDRNNVRIIRVPDTGTPVVLTTRYTGSAGSTDYFEADSPNGLSIFGIITVAQKSTGTYGDVGSGSTGTSDYGGTSVSSGGGGAVGGAPQEPAKEEPASPFQLEEPGPLQSIGITITQSLSVAGVSTTTGPTGSQTIRVDTTRAAQSGSIVTVQNNVITISQPGFVFTVTTKDKAAVDNGIVSGTVQSASMSTSPFSADLSIGTVSVSLDTSLGAVPENAAVTITLTDTVSQETQSAFQRAAQSSNRQIEAIAYIMSVERTNLAVAGPATVTMTVPPDWVMSYGGIETVVISRIGDDQRVELLQTHYKGPDAHGNMVFEGLSPRGLSIFGILTVNAPIKELAIPDGSSLLSPSQPYKGNITDTIPLIRDVIVNNYLLVTIWVIFGGSCGALYILWLKRRGQA
jgi:hypothetical protein